MVSEGTARAMARGVSRLLGADCAVATTGVAGPALQEGRPAGTVCLAALCPGGRPGAPDVLSRTLHLAGGRQEVRRAAALAGIALLRELLLRRSDAG